MRVLMMPDYREGNPYQQLLADALAKRGVEVQFPIGYKRVLPLWRAWRAHPESQLLHLHWLTPYLRGGNALTQTAYCIRLLLDVTLLRAAGVRVIWTIHNRVSHEAPWPALERWVGRRLARKVDRIIVHTRAGLEELRRDLSLSDEKTSVVPHGNYRDAYGPAIDSGTARQALKLPESGRVYLFFGLLRPYKGIERLIGEWRKTIALRAADTLVIAGKAIDDEFAARLIHAAGPASNIVIRPGFVPAERIPILFSAADFVVLPFERILTSGSLILAMTYGKPVIAPGFGGIAETLGEAGDLLYDPEDPDGLRLALERSAGMPVDSVRRDTEDTCPWLDWSGIAEKTSGLYAQLCGTSVRLESPGSPNFRRAQ